MTRLERLQELGMSGEEGRRLLTLTRREVSQKLGIPVQDFGAEEKQMAWQLAEGFAIAHSTSRDYVQSQLATRDYIVEMVTSAGLMPGVVDPQHVIHHVKKMRKKRKLKTKKNRPYIMGMFPSGFTEVGNDGDSGGDD